VTRLVSIIGMSRSGSTLLGLLLGRHRGVIYVGETMNFGAAWSHPRARCRCGSVLRDCEFWQCVVRRAGLDDVPTDISPAVGWRLMAAAAEVADAHTVVDSSKHPGWQRSASRVTGDDALALHLVRDPRGHLASAHIGWDPQRAPTAPPALRSAIHVGGAWVKRNWWSIAAARRWNRRGRARYEDVVAGGELGVPAAWLGRHDPDWIGATHVPTGNPRTRQPGGDAVHHDDRWVEHVPRWMQLTVWLVTLPLVAWYRYPLMAPRAEP